MKIGPLPLSTVETREMMPERVLLIDDDDSFREVMTFRLKEDGYDVTAAANGEEGLQFFIKDPFPVVITDLKMPGLDGMALMKAVLQHEPETLVIVITAFGDIESAVAAMKAGAYEFLPKPCDRDHFKLVVRRAVEHAQLKREVAVLKGRIGSEGKQLLFQSEKMARVIELADRVAASDATVLLEGESGTGKELLARRIHRSSPRKKGPFVAFNCGAIPHELLEDELFGHVKGAFTGATGDRKGRFEQAHGGTLFLDEIAELPADLQTRLLRVLQERVVNVVGRETPLPVDVRVIAATNVEIGQALRAGKLREDLYYRLNVMKITIPPLRERPDDVLPLMKFFLRRYSGTNQWRIPAAVQTHLEALPWPGNVRELENLCQRLALLAEDRVVRTEHLPPLQTERPDGALSIDGLEVNLPAGGASLVELEKAIIVRALEMNGYKQSKTARFLQIPRHVLLYRIEKYGIAMKNDVPD